MYKASRILFYFFSESDVFTDVLEKRIYPVVAGEGILYPFGVYTLSDDESTKDAGGFSVWLNVYFKPNKIAEAMIFADAAKVEIEEQFIYLGSGIDFIDKDQSIVVMLNFKMWL